MRKLPRELIRDTFRRLYVGLNIPKNATCLVMNATDITLFMMLTSIVVRNGDVTKKRGRSSRRFFGLARAD